MLFCLERWIKEKNAPEVRLELTTYRLTAGRATDCAIQELMSKKQAKGNKSPKKKQSNNKNRNQENKQKKDAKLFLCGVMFFCFFALVLEFWRILFQKNGFNTTLFPGGPPPQY